MWSKTIICLVFNRKQNWPTSCLSSLYVTALTLSTTSCSTYTATTCRSTLRSTFRRYLRPDYDNSCDQAFISPLCFCSSGWWLTDWVINCFFVRSTPAVYLWWLEGCWMWTALRTSLRTSFWWSEGSSPLMSLWPRWRKETGSTLLLWDIQSLFRDFFFHLIYWGLGLKQLVDNKKLSTNFFVVE